MDSGRSQKAAFRALGFLPDFQLSSTWAVPGPLDSRVQMAGTQNAFKILLISTMLYFSWHPLDSLHSLHGL